MHDRDSSLAGFRALAVHRFGVWVGQQPGPGLVWAPLRRVHVLMFRYVRNHYSIELPVTAAVGRRVVIVHQGGIVIHPNAVIGDDCVLRQNVTIGAATYDTIYQAPRLERGVQVGCGAVLVGAITIGENARIGPNAVVMSDVPAGGSVFVAAPRILQMSKLQPKEATDPGMVAVGGVKK